MADLNELKHVLDRDGIDGGLRYLNEMVPHRFSAVYRLEGSNLRMVHFFDSEGGTEALEVLRVLPFEHSLCQFAIRDGEFDTTDTRNDPRIPPAAFKKVMISYVGFPLIKANGELFGTFCHFDFEKRDISDSDLEFLHSAVGMLTGYISA